MKSSILIRIKWIYRYIYSIILYFICYNTYFKWNREPSTKLEELFDDILIINIYIASGLILGVFLSYVEFKMKKYINEFNKLK